MKFSLIMATVGRTQEVERFLAALAIQTHRNFELIVVDQNVDNRLAPLLDPYRSRFPIVHLASEPGLSRARNVGLRHAKGEVVGFPDDDCWYPPQLLEQVARSLRENSPDGVTGRVVDESGRSYARFDRSPGLLSLRNVWRRSSSVCVFLRSYVVEKVGGFDETLGVGAGTLWEGGEDIDYPLRIIEAGYKVRYDPDLLVLHPAPLEYGYRQAAGRAYAYGAGIGRVWKKHRFPVWLITYNLLRPFGGTVLNLMAGRTDNAYYHWNAFRGRLKGWLS